MSVSGYSYFGKYIVVDNRTFTWDFLEKEVTDDSKIILRNFDELYLDDDSSRTYLIANRWNESCDIRSSYLVLQDDDSFGDYEFPSENCANSEKYWDVLISELDRQGSKYKVQFGVLRWFA